MTVEVILFLWTPELAGFACGKGAVMAGAGRVRRSFTPEYRWEAARLVVDTGRPVAHVARELGLGEQLLGKWVRAYRQEVEAGPGGELSVEERAELKRLRREVEQLRKDNEFLGKAAAFFASRQPPLSGLS